MFNNLGLFMTMRHICSWQYQSTSRGRWASKRLLMEFDSHLGKKLLLPGLLHKLDTENPHRDDCWTCLKVTWSFGVPDSWKSLWDILQDTAESDWTVFGIFLLHGNVCWILWACRLKMDAQLIQKNFGWLYRQQDVSVISRVCKLLISCLLK